MQPVDQRPNILWISLEDTSPRFGCYGDPVARTPNLDRLAAEGCRYPNAFSVAGVCAPSRSAVITGMYPTAIGTHQMRTSHSTRHSPDTPMPYEAVPPHYVKLVSEYLRAAGYYCTNNVKTDYQFNPPISAWDEWSQQAHWRNRPDADQPFFAVFNFTYTHESGMWADHERSHPADGPLRTDPDQVELPPYLPNTPKARRALAQHYDNIERDDEEVGRLLRELEEDGLAQNTIVFIWSDHGEGLPRAKRWPYDSGIRVPLIVRWPGRLNEGAVDDRLVSMIDLGPTVLSLAGVGAPQHMHGTPFLGPDTTPRSYIYASRDRHDEAYDMVRAVRDGRYKYIRHYYPMQPYTPWIPYLNRHPVMEELWRLHLEGALEPPQDFLFRTRPVEELYDTQNDPHELNNLAMEPAHRQTLQRLREALDQWREKYGDMGDVDEAQMVRNWYPNGRQPVTLHPLLIPVSAEHPGRATGSGGGQFAGPILVQMHCATQGASIVWTTEPGDDARWHLYTGPVRLDGPGRALLRARAHRIGFQPSEERAAVFHIE
ncbi:MAG: sulfatase [Phycisphaeraceae bacterium]